MRCLIGVRQHFPQSGFLADPSSKLQTRLDEELAASRLFPLGLFQLAIDPKLDPPDRQQVEPGFSLARDDLVADAELPFPNARSDRRHGEFDALVDHTNIPPRPQPLQDHT